MEFSIKAREGFYEVRLAGKVDPDKFPEMLDALFAQDAWEPGARILVDESDLKSDDITIAGVQELAWICADRRNDMGTSKIAVYVSRDFEYGLNRMWHIFIENKWDVVDNVFRSRDEAMKWLGV